MTLPFDNIKKIDITNTVSKSFLDYSMSVIISRAIPDVRDGLKPVHRRILYGMFELGILPSKPYKKAARIVGDVMGKYHPHGDSSIYEALVRMAQSFSLRSTHIDGHGNFGSMGGDPAAAMRYTECRLSKSSLNLLKDLRYNTVNFVDNYDNTEKEPSVLPAGYPNLLVNGTEGIAVAVSTKIAPHNLREVCNATIAQIKNPDITLEELMEHIKGPDFPTGAMIMGDEGIKEAFSTGKGSIKVRSVVEIEEKKGRHHLIIKEVPYQVNTENLIEKIRNIQKDYDAYLKERDKKGTKAKEKGFDFLETNGIREETDRNVKNNGVRIVIDLKKGMNPEKVLNYLYKNTQLQTNFSTLALTLVPSVVEGKETLEPKVLPLKDILREYIKHRRIVELRKQKFLLQKKKEEIYKTEGLIKALNKLDETITLIRSSKSKKEAVEGLIALLSVAEDQANYILDMRVQSLANFEHEALRERYDEAVKEIASIEKIISDPKLLDNLIIESLKAIAEEFGKDRQTKILPPAEDINIEDLVEDKQVVTTITHNGYIKRTLESAYRNQRRNGRGVNGMTMHDDDFISQLNISKNLDTMLFFTNKGRVHRLKVYEIPEASARARGIIIKSLLNLEKDENVQTVLSVRDFSDEQFLFFATENGIVKRTKLSQYANVRKNGIAAITLDDNDSLVNVSLASGNRNITLVSKKGMSITFDETQVNSVGRTGRGVKGIELSGDDKIISFITHEDDADLFIASSEGFGKRTKLSEYRTQKRGGKGVLTMKPTDKNGIVVGAEVVQENDSLMMVSKNGTLIKLLVDEISQFSRNTQGTKIINLRSDDELKAVSRIADNADEDEEEHEENHIIEE